MSRARASGPLEGPLLQREIMLLLAIYLAEDGSWVFYAREDGMRIGSCHPNWHQNTRAPGVSWSSHDTHRMNMNLIVVPPT